MVIAIGFLNSFGAYCQWRAFKLSLSKTTLFLPLANVLTIFLAVIFLDETAEWNFKWALGIVLCFFAIFLFLDRAKMQKENYTKEWLFYLLGTLIIFGTAVFLMKVFSSDTPRTQFLIYWYIGAFLGSLPILFLERQNPFKFP